MLFTRKPVNHPGQADRVIEFIKPDSELAKQMDKTYVVKQEVERPKFRPKDVVAEVQKAGFGRFRISPEHTTMWKAENAKDPTKRFGTAVQGSWYWYRLWIDRCISLCTEAGDKYR